MYTYADFKILLDGMLKVDAQTYVSAGTSLLAVVNESRVEWCVRSNQFFNDQVVMNLRVGVATYDLRSTTDFAQRIARPIDVIINGQFLRDPFGRRNKTSQFELAEGQSDYLATANSTPLAWAELPPTSIRLWPPPAQVYANSYVAGYTILADLAGDTASDMGLPVEDVRFLAHLTAANLLMPQASGASLERAMGFRGIAESRMAEIRIATEQRMMGAGVRGAYNNMPWRNVL